MRSTLTAIGLCLAAILPAAAAEVNVYSARHYDTDLALHEAFTRETGITVNLIEGSGDELLARLQAEGARSPADVFITVDGGRLHRLVEADLLAPVESATLTERVPAAYRHPDGLWFGLTTRARVLFYDKARGAPEWLDDYEDLADPRLKGEVCIRSSSNIYNVSLMAEFIEVLGEEAATEWAKGLAANLARAPQGGDRDQIRTVAAGECLVGVSNTYYWGALMASDNPEDRAAAEAVGIIFPNQSNRGTHVNLSGAGVVKTAPNPENAVRFIEFLTSDAAQVVLADSNNEYPVVATVKPTGPIAAYADFRPSGVNAEIFGINAARATAIYDRAGMP
ncbi:MAG: Fe(3+) ABC transporter substrate-binding protein [Gemmobacter sp.]